MIGNNVVAYFCAEFGLRDDFKIYSGGLGILAGDHLKSAADLGINLVGVGLLYHQYIRQSLDRGGTQREIVEKMHYKDKLVKTDVIITLTIQSRPVKVRVWRYDIKGCLGHIVPLYLLDTYVEGNNVLDLDICTLLYQGDRMHQEIVLGLGGVKALEALGYEVERYHMNEGHAAFLTLALLKRYQDDPQKVRERTIFTTHTPVSYGHDSFDYYNVKESISEYLPQPFPEKCMEYAGSEHLNMTKLALNLSGYANGVSKKHGEVSNKIFLGHNIDSITNGVHSLTWTCDPFQKVFDRYIPGWRENPLLLEKATDIPLDAIVDAHQEAKDALINFVNEYQLERREERRLSHNCFTIGFARRATGYKRASLIFKDINRLLSFADGKLQIVFAGKAHPRDVEGKQLIEKIVAIGRQLKGRITVIFIEDYDITIAKLLTSGVDLWLNTPLRPREASGTSGMKAVHNGVPNFSVLDGWWVEGHEEGVTGWAIGPKPKDDDMSQYSDDEDANDMYTKLEKVIMPMYFNDKEGWTNVMRNTIAKNASYFNTHRMVKDYIQKAYRL